MALSIRARRGTAVLTGSLLLLTAASPALGHATIPDGSAIVAGSTAEFHIRVAHGCSGQPTDTVSVQLPDGVVAAQPAYVPAWEVTVETVETEPYERHGETLTERVGVITWSGGSLPDHAYFDFGIRATFLVEPGELAIPVVQRCGDLEQAWIQVPAEGQDPDDLELPAPTITVVAAADGGSEG